MIGVAAKAADLDVVAEFFELFKIPWQVASADRRYDVVLVADDDRDLDDVSASALVVYGSNARPTRGAAAPVVDRVRGPITIRWDGSEWPVYGDLAILGSDDDPGAAASDKGRVESSERQGARTICRIGYDLFSEVRRLLTAGQPAGNAATPTLELHIALLRDRLERLGASLVEVPARPDGYDFVCCLTHDVDFCGITRHRADSTIAGFIWRASVWTSVELLRGRRTLGEACRNWSALAALPLTLAGLARDFWDPFESYAEADRGHASTFFLIPFKGKPGVAPDGTVKQRRAVQYSVRELGEQLDRAAARGSELALHGIDAWRSAEAGREELTELQAAAPTAGAGVRMHWLFFDILESPARLAAAGFQYDATYGYNDAIGHRAGTAQAFTFPGTRLLELPLTIMDTALFYRDRMGLAVDEAMRACRHVVSNVRRFGGAVIINWHDRSLEPERLWRRAYDRLLNELDRHKVWFATAQQAAAWFRWRRSISFTYDPATRAVTIQAPSACPSMPAASVTVARDREGGAAQPRIRFDGTEPLTISI